MEVVKFADQISNANPLERRIIFLRLHYENPEAFEQLNYNINDIHITASNFMDALIPYMKVIKPKWWIDDYVDMKIIARYVSLLLNKEIATNYVSRLFNEHQLITEKKHRVKCGHMSSLVKLMPYEEFIRI